MYTDSKGVARILEKGGGANSLVYDYITRSKMLYPETRLAICYNRRHVAVKRSFKRAPPKPLRLIWLPHARSAPARGVCHTKIGPPKTIPPGTSAAEKLVPPEHSRQKNQSAGDRTWHRTWSAPAVDGPPS